MLESDINISLPFRSIHNFFFKLSALLWLFFLQLAEGPTFSNTAVPSLKLVIESLKLMEYKKLNCFQIKFDRLNNWT